MSGDTRPPAHNAPARAREAQAETPPLRVLRDDEPDTITCHYYREHQAKHVRVEGRWVCPICDPEPPEGVS